MMKKITLFIFTLLFSHFIMAQIPSGSFFEFEFTAGSLANTSPSGAPDLIGNINSIPDRNGNLNDAADITGALIGASVGTVNVNEMTLCFWMKHGPISANERIIQIYGTNSNGFRLQMDGTQLLYNAQVGNLSSSFSSASSEMVNIDDNTWHHIAIRTMLRTPDSLEFDVFLDNVLQPNISNTVVPLSGTITNFLLNASLRVSPTNNYSGDIDDIYFYKSALSNAQISQIYNVGSCTVNIPDANFKSYLVGNAAINTNGNTEIECSEAIAFTGQIACASLSISDLTGIEAFVNLTDLRCGGNQLSSLDVSQNTSLTQLYCSYNQLTNLDLSANTALLSLTCSGNQFTNLNLSSNTMLEYLKCDNNQLTSLDLSNLVFLEHVECYINLLTSLNVSNNAMLEELYCADNQLSNLDLSSTASLNFLSCGNNQLTSLNLANGNNSNMQGGANPSFFALNNPNLTCIQIDAGYTPNSFDWRVDPIVSYSTNCGTTPCTVNIPDANFKAYLVGNAAINTNGNTEIECSEANAFTGQIACASLSISDLTGIEAFVNLTNLNCSNNQLSSLNVTQNTSLTSLNCGQNQLSSLVVTQNTLLEHLSFYNTTISNIDLSQNALLDEIYCDNSALSTLDVSQNSDLYILSCNNNAITNLDVSQNAQLYYLFCNDNALTSLDVTQNLNLNRLTFQGNSLSSIDLSQNQNLVRLDVSNNLLNGTLDLSLNTSLNFFNCSDNLLSNLNVQNGNNSNFTFFNASFNPNLSCIQVDDVAYSTSNWTNISAQTSFSTNCVQTILVNSISVQGQGGATTITTQGGTLQMEASVLPANADDDTYTWSVANGTGVASIDANGLLTASADGTVTVTATANDASGVTGSETITISNQSTSVVFVNSIAVEGQGGVSTISTSGGTLQMEATIFPANATDPSYTWSVMSVTGDASIDANGLLTALSDGTVNVTATANDGSNITGTKMITISNQTVGIQDLAFQNVRIYPNPANHLVNLEISEALNTIRILDLSGKVVQVFNPASKHLNISALSGGIYFLELANTEKKSVIKLIKQ